MNRRSRRNSRRNSCRRFRRRSRRQNAFPAPSLPPPGAGRSFTQRLFSSFPSIGMGSPQNKNLSNSENSGLDVKYTETKKLTFYCQLAHGSETFKIENVGSLSSIYQAIAEKFFDINVNDILFCTVNTHNINMSQLLSTNLALNDFIFAHLKGESKAISFIKSASLLGLTVTDNGNGLTFIKRIQEDSVCSSVPIKTGDHLEEVNGQTVVGLRHYQVARILRSIPVGEEVALKLISPLKNGFSFISKRVNNGRSTLPNVNADAGTKTLRLHSNGQNVIEEAPNKILLTKVNKVLEEYLGVNDDELVLSIWELGRRCTDFMDLSEKMRQSELNAFKFPDELIFDIWGITDDYKNGRFSTLPEN